MIKSIETLKPKVPLIPAKPQKNMINEEKSNLSTLAPVSSKAIFVSSPQFTCKQIHSPNIDFQSDLMIDNNLPPPLDLSNNGLVNGWNHTSEHRSSLSTDTVYRDNNLQSSNTDIFKSNFFNDKSANMESLSNFNNILNTDSLKLVKYNKSNAPLLYIDSDDDKDDEDEIDYVLIDSNSNQFKSFNHSLKLTYIDDTCESQNDLCLLTLSNGLQYYETDGLLPLQNSQITSKVQFSTDPIKIFFTHSTNDYDRHNEDVDPASASIEYELEKRLENMNIITLEINKGNEGLGLSIIGIGLEADTNLQRLAIFVKMLVPGGAVQRDARMRVNDQIIEVNGKSLVGVTQLYATSVLKGTGNTVKFVIGRVKTSKELDSANTDLHTNYMAGSGICNGSPGHLPNNNSNGQESKNLPIKNCAEEVDWSRIDEEVPYVEVSEFLRNSTDSNSAKYKQVEKKYIKAKKLIKEYKKR